MLVARMPALLLLASTIAVTPAQDKVVRLERDLVTLDVTVTNRAGNNVPGLDKTCFEVFDDGVRQEIAFFSDEDQPVTIGIVVDVSGSMG